MVSSNIGEDNLLISCQLYLRHNAYFYLFIYLLYFCIFYNTRDDSMTLFMLGKYSTLTYTAGLFTF